MRFEVPCLRFDSNDSKVHQVSRATQWDGTSLRPLQMERMRSRAVTIATCHSPSFTRTGVAGNDGATCGSNVVASENIIT